MARRIALGLACCMALVYGAQELSASESVHVEATVQCPDAPTAVQTSDTAPPADLPPIRIPLSF